jgi:hypothetical protein
MSWLSIGDINHLRRGRGARLVDEPNPLRYVWGRLALCALMAAGRRAFSFSPVAKALVGREASCHKRYETCRDRASAKDITVTLQGAKAS